MTQVAILSIKEGKQQYDFMQKMDTIALQLLNIDLIFNYIMMPDQLVVFCEDKMAQNVLFLIKNEFKFEGIFLKEEEMRIAI